MKRIYAGLLVLFFAAAMAAPQSASLPPALPAAPQAAEFLHTADMLLGEMSSLLALPILAPLKKSLRSRDEIRAYLLRKMDEDKDANKRYADRRTMEKFGLLPPDYPLDEVVVKVLTEQIAGLYDPEAKEFFIADWTDPDDQAMVMAHELTHALQDQHYQIDKWTDAAKPNDDAQLAREAVLEGSAIAAMFDYVLRARGVSVRDLPELDPSMLVGDATTSPELAAAPAILQDSLLFPYLAGTKFAQQVLKATNGWPDFGKVFRNPPASTQQIMHPELYLKGVLPPKISLPDTAGVLSSEWNKLEENTMGEFGLLEILKQFLDKDRSAVLAATWSADRYALFENQKNKQTLLMFRVALASDADAAKWFGAYSELLELKYARRSNLLRRPNFFSFDTPEQGVFLRCVAAQCFVIEGGTIGIFDRLAREMGWRPSPGQPARPGRKRVNTAGRHQIPAIASANLPAVTPGVAAVAGPPNSPMAP